MARNEQAIWDYLPGSSSGSFTGGPKKGVAHKTQGYSYAGARSTYIKRSLGPHFTIGEEEKGALLYQHLDTNEAASAVANDSGGVQTNKDGAIQVEIVGFSGITMGPRQIQRFKQLQAWLSFVEGIPVTWPAGRPPKDSVTGYGENNGFRHSNLWDNVAGWYGHSQVPENEHWDPAWTDEEWAAITKEEEEENMDLTPENLNQIASAIWNHKVYFIGDSKQPATLVMRDVATHARAAAKIDMIDEEALAVALAPLLNDEDPGDVSVLLAAINALPTQTVAAIKAAL